MDTETRDNDRWMLLAGPLFLLLALAAVLAQGGSPGEKDSAEEVVKHFTDNEGRNLASVFLSAPAAAALMVFGCRLRAGIDDRARAARSLVVAGAAIYAVAIVIGAAVTLATTVAANEGFDAVAQTLSVLSASMWIPLVTGIAVMLLGAGLAVLRTGILPRWMGWVAAVTGVVSLLGPGGFLGFLVAPLWMAAAGVLLYTRKTEPAV